MWTSLSWLAGWQVLKPEFVTQYERRIINIHHSLLAAFSGARPYDQAFARGIKLIGATSHHMTPVLDDVPIAEHDSIRVNHRGGLDDLIRKGCDLERLALARGVRVHFVGRVLQCENRSIVFE
ncbi:MAG: formyltransferase family protein [Chloroflexota bacterium]